MEILFIQLSDDYKSQFRKMDPYGFAVQGHILCLIYQNIISAFVTAG